MSTAPPDDVAQKPRLTVTMAIYAVIAAVVIAAGVVTSYQRAGVASDVRTKATFIAPAAPGGGWDTFMREAQNAMRENGIANNIQVQNITGAAGTTGLNQLATKEGEGGTVMVGGTGLLAGVQQLSNKISLTDVTPIARVVEEYDVIVVPSDSPFETLDDLVQAWKADPGSIPVTGGGSFDQLVVAQLALAAGIDIGDITYIPSSGGGEVVQSLVTGNTAAAASGLPDVRDQLESGRLRALGIAASEPLEGLDIPTLPELGYDVTLTNWRAIFGPPGITADQAEVVRDVFEQITETDEWMDAVERNRWTPVWLDGQEFLDFIAAEEKLVADLYKELNQ